MPAAWHGGPGELVASEVFPGLGVAWVTFGRSPVLGVPLGGADAGLMDYCRGCLTMELAQTRLDGEEQS